jgi:hypothetical protein
MGKRCSPLTDLRVRVRDLEGAQREFSFFVAYNLA